MPKMKLAVVTKPGQDFEIQERDIPQPGPGHARIRVQACGVCFSDHLVKDSPLPGQVYPRSPGHEVAGVIDDVCPGVTLWKKASAYGLDGTAYKTGPASRAAAAISEIVQI